MKKRLSGFFTLFILLISIIFFFAGTGCANIVPPGGGPIDSLPPVLVSAVPADSSTNFKGNRITLNFDEYVDIQNQFENVIVSPTPKNPPIINNHLRTISVRIKDTLEPNTTYSIDFGNGLRDINEGNIYKNFTYIFSTGNTIDENTFSGNVIMAETGKIDTTLIVVLHRNLDDSAVVKERPRYIAKLDGKGNFQFRNLAAGTFAVYVVPNDFSKRYEDTTKPFAFANQPISSVDNKPLTLYAFTLPKIDTGAKAGSKAGVTNSGGKKEKEDNQLRIQTNLDAGRQDLLKNLELTFNKKITAFDSNKIVLSDTNYKRLPNYSIARDTNQTSFTVVNKWTDNQPYILLIDKTAMADSAGTTLRKNDTIRFFAKKVEDYGAVRLRFKNLDLAKNPVLQIVQNDKIIESTPLAGTEWSRKLFNPGEYDLRILFDDNKNGVWDQGRFFGVKRQPEIVITLNTKLSIRANWDNEKDITL